LIQLKAKFAIFSTAMTRFLTTVMNPRLQFITGNF